MPLERNMSFNAGLYMIFNVGSHMLFNVEVIMLRMSQFLLLPMSQKTTSVRPKFLDDPSCSNIMFFRISGHTDFFGCPAFPDVCCLLFAVCYLLFLVAICYSPLAICYLLLLFLIVVC